MSLRIQLPLCHFHSTFTYCAVSIQWQRFERLAYSNRLVVNVTLNWGNLFNPKSGRFRRTFWTACSRQKFSGNFKTGLVEVSRQYCLVCLFLAIVKFTQNTQPFCIFAPAVLRCLGKQERTRDIWENRREPETDLCHVCSPLNIFYIVSTDQPFWSVRRSCKKFSEITGPLYRSRPTVPNLFSHASPSHL